MKIGYIKDTPFPNTFMLTINDKPLVVNDIIKKYNLDKDYIWKNVKKTKWSGFGNPVGNNGNYALIAWNQESLDNLMDFFTSITLAFELKNK